MLAQHADLLHLAVQNNETEFSIIARQKIVAAKTTEI
jgi:hypothetical protein